MTDDQRPTQIGQPEGRLGVLLVGLGAVSTTFIAGIEAVKKGLGLPIGSVSQMGTMGGPSVSDRVRVLDYVPLARVEDLVFGAWDIFEEDAYQTAIKAGVLERTLLDKLEPELERVRPMPAVFDQKYVKKLDGKHKKKGANKWELAQSVIQDIEEFQRSNQVNRMVMVWCGSTEVFIAPSAVHSTAQALEAGLKADDPNIPSSMVYAWAALKKGIPFANGAPNLTVDVPAMTEIAQENGAPICGKDFKTGQTLMKTILAPGLKARLIGLSGWFSTNILGNRDGEVLDDPESFRTKEESKLSVLEHILEPAIYPDLYQDVHHKVRINYYPPRADNKEGWDNLDIFGWLGYPMQVKINFLCRDSILAAPLVLDLVLFLDLAKRAGLAGIQEWLSFYFKSPSTLPGRIPEHDLFLQQAQLNQTLRDLKGGL